MIDIQKACTKCGETKSLDQFYRRSKSKDGHNSKCIDCMKVEKKDYYAKNAERIKAEVKAYYVENSEQRKSYSRKYYADNIDERRAAGARYHAANRDQRNADNKVWRDANADRGRATQAEYRAANSEKRAKQFAEWRAEFPDKMAAAKKAWNVANPERVLEIARITGGRRRARKASVSTVAFSVEQLAQRWAYYGDKCWICGEDATQTDHVKPISKGGAHMLCNLRPACAPCNRKKSDIWPYSPPGRDDIAAAAA